MLRFGLPALVLVACAVAGDLDDFQWREEFADAGRWEPRPTWLSAVSRTASATSDGQAACFRVDEPGLGMKWSATMPTAGLADTPWLAVRYRAENLRTQGDDYLVYLDDRVPGKQLNAIRLCDARADGKWHVAAVDVSTLTEADGAHGLAVQVRATAKGKARLWLDWLAFLPEPPKDAEIIERVPTAPPKPDWVAPLAQAKWVHHRDWLSNPASEGKHSVEREGGGWAFRVAEAGRGMKWSWALPEKVELAGHRYVALRYRATGQRPWSDYTLCVIGKPRGDGSDYASVIAPTELVSDGRWHTVHCDVRDAAAQFETIGALAIQVQAAKSDATLELADIRLVNAIQPSKLADFIDWQRGLAPQVPVPFATIPMDALAKSDAAAWLRHLRIADWFPQGEVTAQGIPFRLSRIGPIGPIGPGEGALAGTSVRKKGELRIAADVKASEVYLLLLAALVGPEEPVYGGGRFRVIRDVDRFRLRLEYADGTADECLPMNVATKQFAIVPGPQVLVAAADPSKPLKAIVLADRCKQAAFALAAVTARTAGPPGFPDAREDLPRLAPKLVTPLAVQTRTDYKAATPARGDSDRLVMTGPWMEADVRADRLATLTNLVHRPTGWRLLEKPCQLIELEVDGKPVQPEDLIGGQRVGDGLHRPDDSWEFRLRRAPKLSVTVTVTHAVDNTGSHSVMVLRPLGFNQLLLGVRFANHDSVPHTVRVVAPRLGPIRLGDRGDETYYLVPKRGAAFDNRPCSYRERYCGLFPVQFLQVFNPSQGRGLVFHTTGDPWHVIPRTYCLEKTGNTVRLAVEYRERTLRPGDGYFTPTTVIRVTDGGWHHGLEGYRLEVARWLRPRYPRRKWFREIFNFRQRFLHAHDPLYDHGTGEFHLERAVEEARREFGGIDYLHLFDWGNCGKWGRIYGRTGDYSPYDFLKGGREAFRKAIEGVQKQGVPTGLYIEGYLLTARGKLGQAHGEAWQSIRRDGKGAWWTGNVEMSLCAGVKAWREVQASTYETKVKELGVDGMYIDQFGFANAGKDCSSDKHGHPVPSYCVRTERDTTRVIRERVEAVKKGVAIYTEETPVDVTTHFQDGSFTYAMNAARRTQTLVPLNIARFAFPDFKTIEILICDKPTGSWATGVRWVFFNGEAIWLEGPAAEWFEPETRAEIRRCYRILRKHRDAFTSLEPVPLVPTEMGGVWANEFPAAPSKAKNQPPVDSKTLYTLYNARHRTVRGEVLRLPHREGATYYDEWHQRPATVRRAGAHVYLATELGPHGAGCLVVGSE